MAFEADPMSKDNKTEHFVERRKHTLTPAMRKYRLAWGKLWYLGMSTGGLFYAMIFHELAEGNARVLIAFVSLIAGYILGSAEKGEGGSS